MCNRVFYYCIFSGNSLYIPPSCILYIRVSSPHMNTSDIHNSDELNHMENTKFGS
jgi:hypothetical protein